ncbi:MAG: hypothetical protein Q8M40_05180 [Legionella sp.]|nr:hypothetical protein [Legionella sp.]
MNDKRTNNFEGIPKTMVFDAGLGFSESLKAFEGMGPSAFGDWDFS